MKGAGIISKKRLRPYLSNLTAKDYSTLFTGKDGNIKLCLINEQYLNDLVTSEDNTKIMYKNNWLKRVDFDEVLQPIAEYFVDLPLMQAIYSVFYQSLVDGNSILEGNTLTIKTNVLACYMKKASRNDKYATLCTNLSQFERVYARFSNGDISKFLTLTNIDQNMTELKFDVSLFRKIVDMVSYENTVKVKKAYKKEFDHELPTHSFLIHSSISRKNRNAYYLVTQIEALLVQAGTNAPEVHITFENLIDRVPSLQKALENDKSTRQYKNVYLERTFKKMYELLKTSTDLYDYFVDLEIPNTIPTQSTLNDVLRITHKGINKEYKPKE